MFHNWHSFSDRGDLFPKVLVIYSILYAHEIESAVFYVQFFSCISSLILASTTYAEDKKKKNTRAEITNKNWMPYFIFSNYEGCKTWLCSSWLGLSHDQIGLLLFCENPFLLVSPLVSMTFLFVLLDTCQGPNYFHFLFLFYSHGKNIYISSSNACFLMKESSSPCI